MTHCSDGMPKDLSAAEMDAFRKAFQQLNEGGSMNLSHIIYEEPPLQNDAEGELEQARRRAGCYRWSDTDPNPAFLPQPFEPVEQLEGESTRDLTIGEWMGLLALSAGIVLVAGVFGRITGWW